MQHPKCPLSYLYSAQTAGVTPATPHPSASPVVYQESGATPSTIPVTPQPPSSQTVQSNPSSQESGGSSSTQVFVQGQSQWASVGGTNVTQDDSQKKAASGAGSE